MKKILKSSILLCGIISLSVSAASLQSISCSGNSSVSGPIGSTQVQMSGGNINYQGTGYSCNQCFYGGHVYKGYNISTWTDSYTVTGNLRRLMWQDEVWTAWEPKNNNFGWGSSFAGSFSFVHPTPGFWNQIVNPSDPNNNRIFGLFPVGGSNMTYLQSSGAVSLNSTGNNVTPVQRNQPGYAFAFNAATHSYNGPTSTGPKVDEVQCVFIFPRWCGDAVIDTDRGEVCDDGNMNSGDGCSNTCQPEITPICNNLTVTPTSVVNGGSVTYTCTGTNVTSYSIIARRPDGTIFASQTGAAGSIIVPASPIGTYSISCFVNGQVSTPASCQKTVENTTIAEPVCTNLAVTPTSVVNGGNVTYTCTGNNVTSWSIQFSRPDGTIFQTLTTPTGTASIPASPTGIYTAKCFVNGQTSTPAICQKTVTNTTNPTPQIDIDKRDANSADLDGSVGNDTQTVTSGTAAVFKIRVTNNGTEDLRNLVLSDAMAPNCAGNVTLPSTFPGTWSNWSHGGSGNNTDNILQVGEWFEYTCNRTNTTAPYTNTATVNATGVTSGIPVDDTDPTPVLVPNTTPTCDNLTVSTTGTTVNYACTGTNATSYRVTQNGTQIGTGSSGSVNVGYGTFTFICYVNDSITSSACQKTVTTTTNPLIQVIKDDNDNHDDRQFLQTGSAATFTIVVKNPGTESLTNVTLADQYAPECNRNSAQTQSMIVNVGNRDSRLDPGESFSYICTRNNVDTYTFPNNENRICVDGQGSTSGIPVNSCDVTRIEFGSNNICQNLQVSQNGNQINALCGPSGSYRLFVLEGPRVVNTYQDNNGQFNFAVGDGNYKLVCVRDGEQTVQPNCQKTITATPKSNYCTMTSSTQFGGAPLRTKLDCRSNIYAQCQIRVMKDGQPWGRVDECFADMVFEEKGVYDATCVIDGNEEQTCSTRVQVDIMTVIRTGPFLPLLIILAMSTAGYLAYRRRKTV